MEVILSDESELLRRVREDEAFGRSGGRLCEYVVKWGEIELVKLGKRGEVKGSGRG